MKKIAFTLCSNNYLAQAQTLAQSFLEYNADYQFFIGLVDRKNNLIDYSKFQQIQILEIEAIDIPEFENMAGKYDIVELNTAVKPFFFHYFLKKENAGIIKYIDPDIMFLHSMEELDSIHTRKDIILTPHITTPIPISDAPTQENKFLNYGIYNLGFLSVKKSETTLNFIEWWKERLTNHCIIDLKEGFFVDQLWINLVPVFYPNAVHISYDLGLNMAHWNFHERILTKDNEGKFWVNEKFPLVFFHFSNYDPLIPDRIVKKRIIPSFEDRPDLKKLFELYRKNLLLNNYSFFKAFPCHFIPQANNKNKLRFMLGKIKSTSLKYFRKD